MKNPVTFGELLRRVEALEALTGTHVSRSELTALNDIAMERICDLEGAAKHDEMPPQNDDKSSLDALISHLTERGLLNWLARIKELQSAAIPRDLNVPHPRCLPVQVTDADDPPRDPNVTYAPHPAYAVAADWKRKYKAAEAELREKAERLSAVDADRERVRAERDEWRAKAEAGWRNVELFRDAVNRLAPEYTVVDAIVATKANKSAADTLERLRKGEQIVTTDCAGNTVALVETSFLEAKTRAIDALKAERDALAAKVAALEQRIAEATNQRGQCYVPLDELTALRRDAERLRDLLALWRTGQILTAMRQLGNAIAPEQKGTGDVGD